MKMMMSTNKTSIMGVILISCFGPPSPPTDIPIVKLLYESSVILLRDGRRRVGGSPGRRCCLAFFLQLLGEKPQLVDTGRAEVVHHIHYFFVARALVRLRSEERRVGKECRSRSSP